ncbi:unnamed protein product [Cuscuta europaea]|uniref:Pectinesterase inhibitor domain-containing protein n=1 Tax=Cuscuta europaea TaxID=41803 RepID=A0A9P0ZM45_CUSEU|nr:unnamed protein product [Cuscuta europaea]
MESHLPQRAIFFFIFLFFLLISSNPLCVHSKSKSNIIHPILRPKKASPAAAATDQAKTTPKTTDELKKICDGTEDAKLCITTISPLLNGGAADTQAVLEAGINASYELAKVGSAMAKKLSMSQTGKAASKVKDCQGSYDDALYNFDETIKALKDSDVGTMNSMLSAVVSDMSDCNDSLAGLGLPLTNIGDKLANMTSVCLGIISQME